MTDRMERSTSRWPERLYIVRHGQSAGNVARETADAAGQLIIDIAERDMDVPLSALGERQAAALGRWFDALDEAVHPTTVLVSPYRRAIQTADHIAKSVERHGAAPTGVPQQRRPVPDERLREREFGILDRYTTAGIKRQFPEQAESRARVGKFYHRPPGGESWCDVILRLRSVLDSMSLHYAGSGSRVVIVAHQVVVLCLRYLIEEMTEEEILRIDHEADVANCGVTEYELDASADPPRLKLVRYNFVAPLEAEGAAVTTSPDVPAAPR